MEFIGFGVGCGFGVGWGFGGSFTISFWLFLLEIETKGVDFTELRTTRL